MSTDRHRTTERLVTQAQKGDRAALEALFTRYLPRVRWIVALRMGKKLRDLADVDDIVQDALLRLFCEIQRYQPSSEGSFRNWVALYVKDAVSAQLRKAGAQKRGGGKVKRFADLGGGDVLRSSIFPDPGPSPSQLLSAKESEAKIESALLTMPRHQREVIVLRSLCEMSYEEVAETLGLPSAAAARKACSRATQQLKEQLES